MLKHQSRAESTGPIEIPVSGVKVTPMDADELHRWISATWQEGRKAAVLAHNLHSLYTWEVNATFRAFYEQADVVLTDGFPVLKLAKWRSGRPLSAKRHRLGTLDWLPGLMGRTPVRRVAVVGATPAGNARTVQLLRAGAGSGEVRGWAGEGWHPMLEKRIVQELQEYRPDFVIVGLGMPLQEEFLSRRWAELPPAIYAAVGGGIDEYAGIQKPPPRWLGPLGLEWAYRLVTQPRRLGHRYVVEPWLLAYLLAAKVARRGAGTPVGA
ncbi:WecB/TagA/CpsF family glycosyltransferase [Kocuria turfanensis]|uniref:Glycosyl transferase n=1 Tax=Kocuria turfanensis TaxID=388357 RepID=A0A512IA95_9MICC|nr:WecB/TagA/CpsF family glycosyltransferase [Kocuria turfanensis]GEO94611.1 glycosyl transferase [Kocuria turfanensis]